MCCTVKWKIFVVTQRLVKKDDTRYDWYLACTPGACVSSRLMTRTREPTSKRSGA
jgi:hypothetical protein